MKSEKMFKQLLSKIGLYLLIVSVMNLVLYGDTGLVTIGFSLGSLLFLPFPEIYDLLFSKGEKSVEEIEDNVKNCISIFLVDVSDTFAEIGFKCLSKTQRLRLIEGAERIQNLFKEKGE